MEKIENKKRKTFAKLDFKFDGLWEIRNLNLVNFEKFKFSEFWEI
jgi:hypothetical protein